MSTALWWLAQNTVTVALALPFVVLACRLFRHRPAVQHVLWLILLVKFMTPPLAVWPWSVQDMQESLWPAESINDPIVADASPDRSRLWATADLQLPMENVALAPIVLPTEMPLAQAAQDAESGPGPAVALLALWVAGAGVYSTLQVRRIARHTAIIRRAGPAGCALLDDVGLVAKELGVRPPRTLLAHGILAPFVWFFGRLSLIWPESMAGARHVVHSRGVIAHELAHIRRRDHWVAWLELIGGIIWWWNPLFWLVRRRLRESAEMACDALALTACGEKRREYAELLLEFSAGPRTVAPALGVGAGGASSFERRLTMILSERVSGRVSMWGIMTAIVLVAAALPGWSLGQQEQAAPASEKYTELPNEALQVRASDKQVAEDLAGKLKELEKEIERLHNLLAAKASVDGVPNPSVLEDSKAKRTYRLEYNNDRGSFCVEAVSQDGRKVWTTLMPSRPNRRHTEITWGFSGEGKGEQAIMVTQTFDDARQKLLLEPATGKIIQSTTEGFAQPPSRSEPASNSAKIIDLDIANGKITRRHDLSPYEAEYQRALADAAAARQRYDHLKASTDKVTKDQLDAAKADWFAREKDKQAVLAGLPEHLKGLSVGSTSTGRGVHLAPEQAEAVDPNYTLTIYLGQSRLITMKRPPTRIQIGDRKIVEYTIQTPTQLSLMGARLGNTVLNLWFSDPKDSAREELISYVVRVIRIPDPEAKTPQPATYTSPLDLAERCLKAVADHKIARSRLARMPKAAGAVSKQEIEEAEIELERAQKQEQLVSAFFADAVKSAKAAQNAVRDEHRRLEELYKQGAVSRAILDEARLRLDSAETQVRQFESVQAIIQATSKKSSESRPQRP